MSQADGIRQYVLVHHVAPARAAANAELTVRAGDVAHAMKLQRRVPNICSVLGSRKFLDMAGLQLLDRIGPRQSTTTSFHYALVESSVGAASVPAAPTRPPERNRGEVQAMASPRRGRDGNAKLTVVIACAGTKAASRGHLTLGNGQRVKFVADPSEAPRRASITYKHPDDVTHSGLSWRDVLVKYNGAPARNPLGLLPAWRLYEPPAFPRVYSDLIEAYGLENVFILSAGWGLVAAGFLLPDYDITFAPSAASYKRRRRRDHYEDFAMLPADAEGPVVFLGGESYVRSFCELTEDVAARRIVFHYSQTPSATNCELRRFEGASPRTWHYQCAYALISRDIRV